MKRSLYRPVAIVVCCLLVCAASSEGATVQSFLANPSTAQTIGFSPWIPSGFRTDSAVIATGTRLPAGTVRLPELIVAGTFNSVPLEIHEYVQISKVGQSDLFVDDPRTARVVAVWPADHALIDHSGRVIGLLFQRGPVHFDFYLTNAMPIRDIRAFISVMAPHA